jgi:hypothetical protein
MLMKNPKYLPTIIEYERCIAESKLSRKNLIEEDIELKRVIETLKKITEDDLRNFKSI